MSRLLGETQDHAYHATLILPTGKVQSSAGAVAANYQIYAIYHYQLTEYCALTT
jgi:hypothetical protein